MGSRFGHHVETVTLKTSMDESFNNISLPGTGATTLVEGEQTMQATRVPMKELKFCIDLNIPLGMNVSKAEVGPVYVSDLKVDSQLANKVLPQDIIHKINDQHVSSLPRMRQLLSKKPSRRNATLVILRNEHVKTSSEEAEEADTVPPPKKRRTTIREIANLAVPRKIHRETVKDTIATAYELHKATETLTKLLEEQAVASQPLLKEELSYNLASMQFERDNILKIDKRSHLTPWENRFRQYVLNNISPQKHPLPKKYAIWASDQRKRRKAFLNEGTIPKDTTAESIKYDIDLLNRVGFSWDMRQCKNWEDHFVDLTEFHRQNGHCRVPQVHPQLGEWVKRMRKEHEIFLCRQQASETGISSENNTGAKRKSQYLVLTPERVDAMEKLGFLWKIRIGRPRKGDERFRLQRKKSCNDESKSDANKESAII